MTTRQSFYNQQSEIRRIARKERIIRRLRKAKERWETKQRILFALDCIRKENEKTFNQIFRREA